MRKATLAVAFRILTAAEVPAASGPDAGVEPTRGMNCFMPNAVRPASACRRERGLQGRFPPRRRGRKKPTLAVAFRILTAA